MNASCMTIRQRYPGFCVEYHGQTVKTVAVNWIDGMLVFSFSDGRSVEVNVSKHVDITSYNVQFGITLTDDGTRFFLQSCYWGLFCFETITGKLLWRNRHAPAMDVGTHGDTVLCYYYGKYVAVLDIETGVITGRYPLTNGRFLPISQDYYLAGPKRGYYEILDSNLQRRAKIHQAQLNPYALDSFIIKEASFAGKTLTIRGAEYASKEFHEAIKIMKSNSFLENHRYERHIPVCIQAAPSSNSVTGDGLKPLKK